MSILINFQYTQYTTKIKIVVNKRKKDMYMKKIWIFGKKSVTELYDI